MTGSLHVRGSRSGRRRAHRHRRSKLGQDAFAAISDLPRSRRPTLQLFTTSEQAPGRRAQEPGRGAYLQGFPGAVPRATLLRGSAPGTPGVGQARPLLRGHGYCVRPSVTALGVTALPGAGLARGIRPTRHNGGMRFACVLPREDDVEEAGASGQADGSSREVARGHLAGSDG